MKYFVPIPPLKEDPHPQIVPTLPRVPSFRKGATTDPTTGVKDNYDLLLNYVEQSCVLNKWSRTQDKTGEEGAQAVEQCPPTILEMLGDVRGQELADLATAKEYPYKKVDLRCQFKDESPENLDRTCRILHNVLIPYVERQKGPVRALTSMAMTFKCARYKKNEMLMVVGIMMNYTVLQKMKQ